MQGLDKALFDLFALQSRDQLFFRQLLDKGITSEYQHCCCILRATATLSQRHTTSHRQICVRGFPAGLCFGCGILFSYCDIERSRFRSDSAGRPAVGRCLSKPDQRVQAEPNRNRDQVIFPSVRKTRLHGRGLDRKNKCRKSSKIPSALFGDSFGSPSRARGPLDGELVGISIYWIWQK